MELGPLLHRCTFAAETSLWILHCCTWGWGQHFLCLSPFYHSGHGLFCESLVIRLLFSQSSVDNSGLLLYSCNSNFALGGHECNSHVLCHHLGSSRISIFLTPPHPDKHHQPTQRLSRHSIYSEVEGRVKIQWAHLIIEQHNLTELFALIEMLYICDVHTSVATVLMQLLSTSHVASETERMNFILLFFLIQIVAYDQQLPSWRSPQRKCPLLLVDHTETLAFTQNMLFVTAWKILIHLELQFCIKFNILQACLSKPLVACSFLFLPFLFFNF